MRASEGLADCVLYGSDDSLHCPNTSVVFGEGDPEFNRPSNDLHLGVNQILACLDNVESGVDPDSARGASQCKGASESTGDALGAVFMEDFQVDSAARLERQSTTRTHLFSVISP